MNVSDRVCSLECVKKGGTVQEFVGPVKIVLVDPPVEQYNRRKAASAFIAVATMMMAANTVFILFFVLGFKLPTMINLHILLCTVGSQFCTPLAILMINTLHGPSAPLKKSTRRVEHIILQLIGLLFSLIGGILAVVMGEKSVIDPPDELTSPHFFSGCVALGLTGLSFLYGPCVLAFPAPKCIASVHRFFGVLALIAGSVCFIFGIIKPTLQMWFYIVGYMAPTYIVLFFTAFYTLVVITTPLLKCCYHESDLK